MEGYLRILADAGVVVYSEKLDGALSLQTLCGIVLFHVAALSGSIKNIELLLKLGFPVDVKGHDGLTALFRAVNSGNLESIEFLIKKGANRHLKTPMGGTLLHSAASAGQVEAIEMLLKHNFQIDVKDKDDLTPLYRAVEHDQFEAADFLLEKGADVFTGIDGTTLLHLAAFRGCITGIRCLLDLNFDLEALNDDGYSPLYFAAKAGKIESMIELIDNGAELLIRDIDGHSLLHLAASKGDEVAAKTLIECGIDVNITGGWWGLTPLHICAASGNISMGVAKLLIENKANANFKATDGRTPIDFALRNNHLEMVFFLSSLNQ